MHWSIPHRKNWLYFNEESSWKGARFGEKLTFLTSMEKGDFSVHLQRDSQPYMCQHLQWFLWLIGQYSRCKSCSYMIQRGFNSPCLQCFFFALYFRRITLLEQIQRILMYGELFRENCCGLFIQYSFPQQTETIVGNRIETS